MLHSKYRWNPLQGDQAEVKRLAEELNISPLLAALLITRGIKIPSEANMFLGGSILDLHDPFTLHGMKEAVPRIKQAVLNGEKILIYGDYDGDGVSSTALMIYLMRKLGADFEYYIPHRSKEGYGLHIHALEQAIGKGVSLIITVDTGISAVDQIAYANGAGVDVIVTDHHEPPSQLPDAYALINPKLPFCPYPFKGLAGVGVAYKLAQALLGTDIPEEWTELVALGTIADLMPLTGENRVLVKSGLARMSSSSFAGITALLGVSGWSKGEVDSTRVGFGLAPRINASGRMSHASQAVALLTADHLEEAEELAHELDILNKERQLVVDRIVQEAKEQLDAKISNGQLPNVIVVAGEGWNVGVVGIVASRLLDQYYRPTIVLGINPDTGECKGSARSIPGLDIYEALTSCSDILDHFGGHPSAAGMSLDRSHLDAFESRLEQFAVDRLTSEHFIPVMEPDLECGLEMVTLPVIRQLEGLAPYGMGNPCPRLLIRGIKLVESKQIGKEGKHLKMLLRQNGCSVDAVAFGKGHLVSLLSEGAVLDIVAEAGINEWNGSSKPQLLIQDLSVPHLQVFDYRGTKQPFDKIREIQESLLVTPGDHSGMAAVVSNQDNDLIRNIDLNDFSLWVYDREVGIIPFSSESSALEREGIRTLFVLHIPDTREAWDNMLTQCRSLERVYLLHSLPSVHERIDIPDREQFKMVYKLVRQFYPSVVREEEILSMLMGKTKLSRRMLLMIIGVFEELGFMNRSSGTIKVIETPPKQPLEASSKYRALGSQAELEQILFHARVTQITEWMLSRNQGAS